MIFRDRHSGLASSDDACSDAPYSDLHIVISIATTFCLGVGVVAALDFTAPAFISIPAGAFVAGLDLAEREAAYALDEAAYSHDRTRKFG